MQIEGEQTTSFGKDKMLKGSGHGAAGREVSHARKNKSRKYVCEYTHKAVNRFRPRPRPNYTKPALGKVCPSPTSVPHPPPPPPDPPPHPPPSQHPHPSLPCGSVPSHSGPRPSIPRQDTPLAPTPFAFFDSLPPPSHPHPPRPCPNAFTHSPDPSTYSFLLVRPLPAVALAALPCYLIQSTPVGPGVRWAGWV